MMTGFLEEEDSKATEPPRPTRTRVMNGNAAVPLEGGDGVALGDFFAYMPSHSYIFAPTREMWPAASVNARIPPC